MHFAPLLHGSAAHGAIRDGVAIPIGPQHALPLDLLGSGSIRMQALQQLVGSAVAVLGTAGWALTGYGSPFPLHVLSSTDGRPPQAYLHKWRVPTSGIIPGPYGRCTTPLQTLADLCVAGLEATSWARALAVSCVAEQGPAACRTQARQALRGRRPAYLGLQRLDRLLAEL